MALVPALGVISMRRKRVGRGIIAKLRVCPSVSVRKSLGILFDERNRFQSVRYQYEVRRLCAPFHGPLDLRNLGAVRELLAGSGKAVSVSGHHRGIGDDHLDA